MMFNFKTSDKKKTVQSIDLYGIHGDHWILKTKKFNKTNNYWIKSEC